MSKPKPAAQRNHYARVLAEKRALVKSMREMLDAYWGEGDGEEAPEFIKRAARLARWKCKSRMPLPQDPSRHFIGCYSLRKPRGVCNCAEIGGFR